mgnify:CR=1 FL=1
MGGVYEGPFLSPTRRIWAFTPREVEQALVPPLARLRLRQIPGGQGDGLHHAHRHVDLGGGQDLWAVLGVQGCS